MSTRRSLDYVFRENLEGDLEFVGDFDGLYLSDPDPWDQSGEGERMVDYYKNSRRLLNQSLARINPKNVLEVGCGLGVSTQVIADSLPDTRVDGVDISKIAVKKARRAFPDLRFYSGDIGDDDFKRGETNVYDVVILHNVLWYILHCLPDVCRNSIRLLTENGRLIVCNAFLINQRFGKDIIDGFEGMRSYALKNWGKDFGEEHASRAEIGEEQEHIYGCLSLKRTKGMM
jgi:SAM-dependent methyltransferase